MFLEAKCRTEVIALDHLYTYQSDKSILLKNY